LTAFKPISSLVVVVEKKISLVGLSFLASAISAIDLGESLHLNLFKLSDGSAELVVEGAETFLGLGADDSGDEEGKEATNGIEEAKSLPAPVVSTVGSGNVSSCSRGEEPHNSEGEEVLDAEAPVEDEGLNPALLFATSARWEGNSATELVDTVHEHFLVPLAACKLGGHEGDNPRDDLDDPESEHEPDALARETEHGDEGKRDQGAPVGNAEGKN